MKHFSSFQANHGVDIKNWDKVKISILETFGTLSSGSGLTDSTDTDVQPIKQGI